MIANGANAIRTATRVLNRRPWVSILLALCCVAWLTTERSDRGFRIEAPELDAPSSQQLALVGRALYLGVTRLVSPETRAQLERSRARIEATVVRIEATIERGRRWVAAVREGGSDEALVAGGRRRIPAGLSAPCG
jgi:hypothetical protein